MLTLTYTCELATDNGIAPQAQVYTYIYMAQMFTEHVMSTSNHYGNELQHSLTWEYNCLRLFCRKTKQPGFIEHRGSHFVLNS